MHRKAGSMANPIEFSLCSSGILAHLLGIVAFNFELIWSSVIVDGTKFVSPHVFLRQKEAKQNAAKLALDGVLSKMKLDGISLIPNDTTFCKTILHEYAAKMNLELPRYTTSKSGAHFSTFITSVFFDGKTYKGVPARSKRDAEQLGARTVVDWILGKSDRSIVMAEIIKSKGKFFDAFSSGNGSFVPHDDVMPLKMTLDYQHGSIAASEKDMHSGSTAPQNNIVLLNASFANHPGYRNSKENNMHVLSRSSNLPVHAAVHPTLPAMVENAKGKIRQWKNQLQGSTNGHLYYVISEFCPPQVIVVKITDLSDDPAIVPGTKIPTTAESASARTKRVALSRKNFHKLIFSLLQGNIFCKSILHEYAAKMRMGLSTYTTSQLAGLFPTFISSVVFDRKMYVGGPGKSKQEAKQFGARTVIDRKLGESDMSTVMTEVIKSKGILVDAFNRGSGSIVSQDDNMPLKLTLDNHSGYTTPFENDMHVLPTNGNLPVSAADYSILPTIENPKGKTVKKNNQPEGSTSGHFGPVSNNSSPAQVIEVETEVVLDDQSMHVLSRSSNLPAVLPTLPAMVENAKEKNSTMEQPTSRLNKWTSLLCHQ
ncbi:uncharacterized protein LOC109819779 isoform X3 [Asparagus officinalis]|uniref:uncharacterized protein LOC109819779 isoform X3 n=1 Tax=Asparagus officinalis TaxID=4686 RepID=UPI00098E021C|nr:uncharacterized protein LOC109819779 isoform X3 [Asparagus officinalis]